MNHRTQLSLLAVMLHLELDRLLMLAASAGCALALLSWRLLPLCLEVLGVLHLLLKLAGLLWHCSHGSCIAERLVAAPWTEQFQKWKHAASARLASRVVWLQGSPMSFRVALLTQQSTSLKLALHSILRADPLGAAVAVPACRHSWAIGVSSGCRSNRPGNWHQKEKLFKISVFEKYRQ